PSWPRPKGAYSLVILTRDAVFAVRDPLGLRPLCLGQMSGGGYVVTSESCALGTIGAEYVREVRPGEIVRLDREGLHSRQGREAGVPGALCVFEYVYFARPDSMLEEQIVHRVRQRLGAELAREAPAQADVVVGVPDSATPAAIGYAQESGIPYSEGLTKNRYIGRTFIQPDDQLRKSGIHLKYNPLTANLAGQRVVLIDDSIVRGNTAGPLVRLLREGGAVEVHLRVSSPPVRHPCFMGVDMATHEELIAHRKSVEAIRDYIGADSLAFLSHGGMMRAVRQVQTETSPTDKDQKCGHCSACFTGQYPVHVDEWWLHKEHEKLVFEDMWG
ncbi:MAG: amidophosphoribosyltransferase, partial [Anaerolineales bacterium]|nr:amidophosphoribosyltransferase [Anaerolineales bacterium]